MYKLLNCIIKIKNCIIILLYNKYNKYNINEYNIYNI